MLVAKKQEYYYENYEQLRKEKQSKAQKPQKAPEAKPGLLSRVVPIFMILVFFAMASLIVMRYARISENNQTILKLEKALEEQYKVQEELKLELTYQADLNYIEEIAKDSLGMNYPSGEQMRFVEFPEESPKLAQVQAAQQPKPSIWQKLLSLID